MKSLVSRFYTRIIIISTLVVGFFLALFVMYWLVVWPIPPQFVLQTSPWLEPKIRAYAKNNLSGDINPEWVLSYGEAVYPLLLDYIKSSDQNLRCAGLRFSIEILGNVKPAPQVFVPEWIRAANDTNLEISQWGSYALIWLPPEQARPDQIKLLAPGSKATYVARHYALRGLVNEMSGAKKKEDAEAMSIIIDHLSDPHPGVRAAAVQGLLEIGDPLADEEVKKLEKDPDTYVREKVEVYFKYRKP